MVDDLVAICRKAVRLGESLGADEVEVYAADGHSIDAVFENNVLKMAKKSVDSRIGIRVFRKRSLGFSTVNRSDADSIERTVRQAIALSRNAPPDKFNSLPSPKARRRVRGVFDDAVSELDEGDIFSRASEMIVACRGGDKRIIVDGGHFTAASGSKAIANSLGVEDTEERTSIGYDIGAHAVEGSKVSSMDYRFDACCSLKGDTSEGISKELGEAVVESLSTKKIRSRKGAVVLSPFASIEVLLGPVLYSVDAYNVQKGTSKFKGKVGRRVSSKMLSILDDGTIPGGVSSSAFDREGRPHKPVQVLKGGVLGGYLYYSYTANKDKVESTGHAGGGPGGVPSATSTNIIVKNGARRLDDLVGDIDSGLLVQRFSGRVNPISGDFSGVAKGSKSISKGSLGPVVRETMISGNLYEILERVSGVSREVKKYGSSSIPWIAVDEVSITGS